MRIQRLFLALSTTGIMLFLYVPVVLLIVFSFNASPMSVKWQSVSLAWYQQLFSDAALAIAAQNSLIVALTSTVIAVIMGTGAAVVIDRRHSRGKSIVQGIFLLPLVMPEILMGVALLLFFVMCQVPLGLGTVIIGHIVFNLPLVIVMLGARLHKLDPSLEEAAQDLGATNWQTFRWITLPLLKPAIVGSALMAFTISLDDFVVTFFTAGPGATTLPLRVFSMIKTGITPEVNALSALLVLVSMVLIGLSLMLQGKKTSDFLPWPGK